MEIDDSLDIAEIDARLSALQKFMKSNMDDVWCNNLVLWRYIHLGPLFDCLHIVIFSSYLLTEIILREGLMDKNIKDVA